MSIFGKINRIQGLRNAIRDKLVAFGIVGSSGKLEDCKNAVVGMTDNTKKTTTATAINGVFSSGVTEKIFVKPGEGYCSTESLVAVPLVNLREENIKQGVNVGGVVGTLEFEYGGILTFSIYNGSRNGSVMIYDKRGLIFTGQSGVSANGSCYFKGNMIFVYTVNSVGRSGAGAEYIGSPVQNALLYRIESNTPTITAVLN